MARQIDGTKLAWMAGVVELRGKVTILQDPMRRTVQLRLRLQSQHVVMVQRLCAYTGIEINDKPSREIHGLDRRGCVEHCPERHQHTAVRMPRMAHWGMTGVGAAIVLHGLAPHFLGVLDLTLVDQYLNTLNVPSDWRKPGRGMKAVFDSVNRLRTIGWEIPEPLTTCPRKWIAEG